MDGGNGMDASNLFARGPGLLETRPRPRPTPITPDPESRPIRTVTWQDCWSSRTCRARTRRSSAAEPDPQGESPHRRSGTAGVARRGRDDRRLARAQAAENAARLAKTAAASPMRASEDGELAGSADSRSSACSPCATPTWSPPPRTSTAASGSMSISRSSPRPSPVVARRRPAPAPARPRPRRATAPARPATRPGRPRKEGRAEMVVVADRVKAKVLIDPAPSRAKDAAATPARHRSCFEPGRLRTRATRSARSDCSGA